MQLGERLSFPGALGVELDKEPTMGNQFLLGLFRRWQIVVLAVFFRHPPHLLTLIPQGGSLPLIPACEPGMIIPQDEFLWRTGRVTDRDCQQRGTEPSAQAKVRMIFILSVLSWRHHR